MKRMNIAVFFVLFFITISVRAQDIGSKISRCLAQIPELQDLRTFALEHTGVSIGGSILRVLANHFKNSSDFSFCKKSLRSLLPSEESDIDLVFETEEIESLFYRTVFLLVNVDSMTRDDLAKMKDLGGWRIQWETLPIGSEPSNDDFSRSLFDAKIVVPKGNMPWSIEALLRTERVAKEMGWIVPSVLVKSEIPKPVSDFLNAQVRIGVALNKLSKAVEQDLESLLPILRKHHLLEILNNWKVKIYQKSEIDPGKIQAMMDRMGLSLDEMIAVKGLLTTETPNYEGHEFLWPSCSGLLL